RWYIIPRMLRDVSSMNLRTTVFGHQLSMPIAVAPTAMQKMAHPLGECANAAAAGKHGTLFTLSTISTSSIEEVAQYAPDTLKFFQLYIYKDRALTLQLVRRAEQAGYRAIVLTIDAPNFGIRRADLRNGFTLPNKSSIHDYVKTLFDQSLTWKDLEALVASTALPVVAKGVLSRADAKLALKAGVAAVWVSNHGGRQIDGVPPTIEALPHIVAEVNGRCPVFVDGGFTEGASIFKALALGASLVFVGRPAVWGLAVAGEQGVYNVLDILKKELENIMCNAG
ncbi:FMN-dependent dehydrogenase, partial [Trinorchestia longiramus]